MGWQIALIFALLSGCASIRSTQEPACKLSQEDRAWLDRSVRGWIATRTVLLRAKAPGTQDALIFDKNCELRSSTALLTGDARWLAGPIVDDAIQIGEQRLPVGVVSATIGDKSGTRFVMSTPSVWAAANVRPGSLGLSRVMSAVMMHEATHVFQMSTYGKDIDRLQRAHRLTDAEFNDDAIQARFADTADFAASVARETELFFASAAATDDREAVRLARSAREAMIARATRYYTGDQSYQSRAEDLWLTMEGSAQWAGYRWLLLPKAQAGGGVSPSEAMSGFGKRGKSWTQLLGLAIFLTVERLDGESWKAHVFGDGSVTILQILDQELARRSRVAD